MKIKIKMTKRLMVVICIIVAALSFMGGMVYKYEEYTPIVVVSEDQSKYYFEYIMPLDKETSIYWLDWAASWHQYYIDHEIFTEDRPFEFHQEYRGMYVKIKEMFFEFEKEWEINE